MTGVAYIRVDRFCEATGYTDKAVRGKIRTLSRAWGAGARRAKPYHRCPPDSHERADERSEDRLDSAFTAGYSVYARW